MDAEGSPSPPSSSRSGDPPRRGTRPTVDAEGSSSPPSSSRSGDPLAKGGAVRHRYHGRTNGGIASSQSPLDSASALRRKLLSLPCSSFSDAIRFAGFASETRVVASLPLNDVQGLRCGAWGAAVMWTRGLKVFVIQRPQAVESPRQGHSPNSGRGRAALSTVILAKRESPGQGRDAKPWTRNICQKQRET